MAVPENDLEFQTFLAAFREGLQKLGWVEGRNIRIDTRWAGPDVELIQRFAKELIALQPDLIVSQSTPTTAVLKQQTSTIPIIFVNVVDPVGSGFVASFPRPGGNVTGYPYGADDGRQMAGAAQGDCAARQPGRPPIQPGNRALCRILPEPLQSRRRVLRRAGDFYRRAASYADRILRGSKPSELPVQAPVKFELVINMKTAKALGLDVPVHLQQRADEVIE